jgi:hypothetical protein
LNDREKRRKRERDRLRQRERKDIEKAITVPSKIAFIYVPMLVKIRV